jgi:hypothetical protein
MWAIFLSKKVKSEATNMGVARTHNLNYEYAEYEEVT